MNGKLTEALPPSEHHDLVRIPISVVVLARNEEANIEACLRSLRDFAEVFVVDSLSTDRTRELSLAHRARVVEFKWNGHYPKKKQWALENVPFSHDWVLYVDADELVTPELAQEIRHVLESGPCKAGYFVGLDYTFLGRTLRHGQRVQKLVLFERERGRFEDLDDLDAVNMWEVEGHYQPRIDGPTGTLRAALFHDDHDSLFHYFERHNRYSDWEAIVGRKAGTGERARVSDNNTRSHAKRIFGALPFKPLAFFVHSYVVRLGFLDGRAGYHYALAKAFYYWQIHVKELELADRSR